MTMTEFLALSDDEKVAYMTAREGTEEEGKEMKRRLGTVVLRGNNVVSISPQ